MLVARTQRAHTGRGRKYNVASRWPCPDSPETQCAARVAFGTGRPAAGCAGQTGRVQFGYIYGVAMVGCIGLYSILNLMAPQGMTLGLTASVLGYCLLPMVALSAVGVVVSLK